MEDVKTKYKGTLPDEPNATDYCTGDIDIFFFKLGQVYIDVFGFQKTKYLLHCGTEEVCPNIQIV